MTSPDRPTGPDAPGAPEAPAAPARDGVGDGVVLDGTWAAAVADEDLRRRYPDVDFDDRDWAPLTVPGHWRSAAPFADSDGPLLLRTRFATPDGSDTLAGPGAGTDGARPDAGRRDWLTLDGVFYTSDVWLDGSYLGDTEGYFFPHTFEVTDALAARTEHTLALEVSCRPEPDKTAKRNLTGVFQHWDLLDQGWNPGGIWRSVRLEQTGPVRIEHLRVLCQDATTETATVFIRAVLDTVEARAVDLVTRLVPAGGHRADGVTGAGIEHHLPRPLAAGENRVEWTVTVPDPQLWWPHVLGDQPLYDVEVEVRVAAPDDPDERPDRLSDARRRRIGLRRVEVHDWIYSVNGERLFLKGANQGPSAMALADATPDLLAGDVARAKAANLDFLRVHAHVAPPALYDAADEAGLLLWQDMPLQWGYHRSVRAQARRQARELVDLLAHHPSVFTWCGHNEPMAIDVEPAALADPRRRNRLIARAAVGQMLPAWNKSVLDRSIKRVIDKTDGSRPVVPHSGILPHPPQFEGTDTHSYLGWYYGDERDFPAFLRGWPRLARFVTEFGAQAVPEDAAFLHPERWPDLDWDHAARTHALQKQFFDAYVPPADHATFEAWRAATQRYQAELIRHHVETLRRIKYRPCGGFAQFCLADGYPSVTWSVLGHDRQPKLGYDALRAACAPVIITADRLPATLLPGDRLALDLHVVSDVRVPLDDLVARATLTWGAADRPHQDPVASTPAEPAQPAVSASSSPRTTGAVAPREWRWQGPVPADSCVLVGRLSTVVPDQPGPVTLDLALTTADGGPVPTGPGRPALAVRARQTAVVGR